MPSKSVHTMRIKDLAIAYDALSRHGHDSASAQSRILELIAAYITKMELLETPPVQSLDPNDNILF